MLRSNPNSVRIHLCGITNTLIYLSINSFFQIWPPNCRRGHNKCLQNNCRRGHYKCFWNNFGLYLKKPEK